MGTRSPERQAELERIGAERLTSERDAERFLLAAGMLVGYSGMTWALARAYLSAEGHGDI